jgi:large subunit ribosomal protein L16
MNLKSLQKLKSKLSLKNKILSHKFSKKGFNYNLNIINPKNPKIISLAAIETGYLIDKELVAFFKFLSKAKSFKKRVYVRSYPFLPSTKKPAEVRMGKGKGKIDHYCKPIAVGTILIDIRLPYRLTHKSSYYKDCKNWLLRGSKLFSVKTKVVGQDF